MYRSDPHFDKRMKLVEEALKKDRSVEEIQQDMREAGIIGRDENNPLRTLDSHCKQFLCNNNWLQEMFTSGK